MPLMRRKMMKTSRTHQFRVKRRRRMKLSGQKQRKQSHKKPLMRENRAKRNHWLLEEMTNSRRTHQFKVIKNVKKEEKRSFQSKNRTHKNVRMREKQRKTEPKETIDY